MKKIYFAGAAFAAVLSLTMLPAAAQAPKDMVSEVYEAQASAEETTAFTAEYFERRLGLPKGDLISARFTILPNREQGVLVLDGVAVEKNETLTRSQLERLCFVPAREKGKCWFSFIPQCSRQVAATVSLTVTEGAIVPPTIENDDCTTAKNVSVRRTAQVTGGSGEVAVLVSNPPQKGYVQVEGTTYTYTPFLDATGKDSFTLSAVDSQGSCSKEALVTVSIQKKAPVFSFTDMKGSPSEYAALKLSESGVMTGEKTGEIVLFYPEKEVNNGDFLVMVLNAAGKGKNLSSCVNTGLPNDKDIPLWLKPYVQEALSSGILETEPFYPKEVPTRAQAVYMVNKAAQTPQVTKFHLNVRDEQEIPQWAVPSYMAMGACQMLPRHTEEVQPMLPLNRSAAADLLLKLAEESGVIER